MNNTPNVVGGLTPEFTDIGAMLCENVSTEVVKVTDCKTAEGVKIIENIFRNVNIALVNELALIFEKMDIDIWESIEAAKTTLWIYGILSRSRCWRTLYPTCSILYGIPGQTLWIHT